MKIARENVKEVIAKAGGTIFSVEFTKKDGSVRKMVARKNVTSYLKGGQNNVVRPDRPYITVFDMKKKAYRTVNLRTLRRCKIKGQEYEIV